MFEAWAPQTKRCPSVTSRVNRTQAGQERALADPYTRIFREVQAWFEDYDIVATPTLSRTALSIDHDFFSPIEIDGAVADAVRKVWYPYTLPFNLSGNPAVTLPCGWGEGGLPIGLQLVGPHLGDARLLRAAAL
jgi:aspartyl-tRNA(Asn)/glutamyl-tRNA(Gln) amidotransferase subunit A